MRIYAKNDECLTVVSMKIVHRKDGLQYTLVDAKNLVMRIRIENRNKLVNE